MGETRPTYEELLIQNRELKQRLEEIGSLKSLFEGSPASVYLQARDHSIKYFNRNFEKDFGAPDGRRCYEVLQGRTEPCEECPTFSVFETGEAKEWEWTAPDGRSFYVKDVPYKDADGTDMVLEFLLDISRRKKVEDELRKSEEKYRVLFNSFPLGITISDKDRNIIETNEMAEKLLGLSKEEQEKRTIDGEEWKIISPNGEPMPAEEYASVRALKEDCIIENVVMGIVKPDTDVRWLSVTAAPLQLDDKGVVIAYSDITEKKKSEEMLKQSEAKYRRLIESSPDLIFTVDTQGNYIDSNRALHDLMGYSVDDYHTMGGFDTIHPDDLENAQKFFQQVVEGKEVRNLEYRYMSKDGRYIDVLLNAAPVFDDKGNIIYCIGFGKDITERKQFEQELKRNEEFLRNTGAMAKVGGWEFYPETQAVIWTDQTYHIHEIPVGTNPALDEALSFYHPEDRKILAEAIDKAATEGEPYDLVVRFTTAKGKKLWTHTICKPEVVDGKVVRLRGVFQDITEHKLAQQELKLSEEKYRGVFDESVAAIFVIDNERKFIDVNQAGLDMLGYSREELLGMSVQKLDADHVEVTPAQEELLGGGRLVNHEHQIRKKDGSIITVLNNSRALTDGENNVIGFQSTLIDITDRKKNDETISRLLEQNTAIINESPIGISIYDENGNCMSSNQSLADMIGASLEQAKAQNFHEITSWKTTGIYDVALRAIKENIPMRTEFDSVTSFGKKVFLDCYLVPFASGGLLFLAMDNTEKRKIAELQKQMAEQEKMALIGRVAGKMAHDFNNVLGITLGTSELLLSENIPEEIASEIRAIKESAERGREITQNLLFFAKDREAKYCLMDLNDRINSILKGLKSEMEDVHLNVDFGPGLNNTTADPSLLENAIINLVQNAIHATGKVDNPKISISTSRTDDTVRIEISDNGCGIPEEHHEHIYEPSFTLKGSMDKKGVYSRDIKGSGYGLANAKRGIEKHGGKISFESRVGEGTTFRIEIPIIDAGLKAEEIERLVARSKSSDKRILVVEDEAHFGNMLYKLLRSTGCKVNLAGTGEVALDFFSENEYDAVSLDFVLPDMNGMDVYRHIREKDKDVPIVFVSGNFEFMQSMIDLKDTDPNVDHLAKPFNNIDYLNKICECLKDV